MMGNFDVSARVLVSATTLWIGCNAALRADAPPSPPRDREVRSPSGQCVARAEVAAQRIVGFRLVNGRRETLWTLPEYRQSYAVADDCRILVVIYAGANELNLDDRYGSTLVFTFYENANEVRKITLGEIYPDLSVLNRTTSHWTWYESVGWVGKDWIMQTVDGRTLTFTVHLR
jgi:hypothetical protein